MDRQAEHEPGGVGLAQRPPGLCHGGHIRPQMLVMTIRSVALRAFEEPQGCVTSRSRRAATSDQATAARTLAASAVSRASSWTCRPVAPSQLSGRSSQDLQPPYESSRANRAG